MLFVAFQFFYHVIFSEDYNHKKKTLQHDAAMPRIYHVYYYSVYIFYVKLQRIKMLFYISMKLSVHSE